MAWSQGRFVQNCYFSGSLGSGVAVELVAKQNVGALVLERYSRQQSTLQKLFFPYFQFAS